jgi:hypothetical protein
MWQGSGQIFKKLCSEAAEIFVLPISGKIVERDV